MKTFIFAAVLLALMGIVTVFFFKLIPRKNLLNPISIKTFGNIPTRGQVKKEPPRKAISLEKLFSFQEPVAQKVTDETITLIATGDVIPARMVNVTMTKMNDFSFPFKKTADFLRTSDIVFINLESPLTANCVPTAEGMSFCGNQKSIAGLLLGKVTVASIANNHAGNYGLPGVKETIHFLQTNDIEVTGNGMPAIVSRKGKTFGFLGFNDIGATESGIAWASEDSIKDSIRSLRPKVDFLIVTYHWGTEYVLIPTDRQRDLAHLSIDSGADLVIGNHPHWVQGVEKYHDKFITFAHGNFVFDQMWSPETREGVVGKYLFGKSGLVDISFYPVIIDNYSQPRFADKEEAKKILSRMKESTLKITPNELLPIP